MSDFKIAYIALNSIFGLITLVGNALIMIAVYKTTSLRNASNYFICSLALSDFMVGGFINTNNAILTGSSLWFTGHPLKRVEQFFYIQTIVATTISLCVISYDRYLAIKYPLRYYAIMTNQRCFRMIAFVWVTSIAFGMPAGFLGRTSQLFALWLFVLIVGFCVPLLVMIFCYTRIMRIAKIQQRKIAAERRLANSFRPKEFKDATCQTIRSKRAAVTFAVITIIFIVTFAPDLLYTIIKATNDIQKGKEKGSMVGHWLIFLLYTSSATNPFVYGFRSREYRIAFKKILQLWKKPT